MPHDFCSSLLTEFAPTLPIEECNTPPGSWYTNAAFFDREMERVFQRCWIPVGRLDQIEEEGDYFTGQLVGNPYVVARGKDGETHAHHNVCRHKAAIVAHQEDESQHRCDFFQCPYHGWEYHLDGRLKKAPMLGSQKDFSPTSFGLEPISVGSWGPFVFLDLDGPLGGPQNPRPLAPDVEPIARHLDQLGLSQLKFYKRYAYDLNCNWKVFTDNSLDGGYHVKYAHEGLASGLDMEHYETHIYDRSSVQVCRTKGQDQRLGDQVMYAYLFPNFFINRYGHMMDTNIVLPISVDRCRVIFDFYFDFESLATWEARKKIRQSITSSHTIQLEDVTICESAQQGMESMAWQSGRYSSLLERAVHAFHCLLWHELQD